MPLPKNCDLGSMKMVRPKPCPNRLFSDISAARLFSSAVSRMKWISGMGAVVANS